MIKILGFTVAPCSGQMPWSLCLVCTQMLSNDTTQPSTVDRHFALKAVVYRREGQTGKQPWASKAVVHPKS